MIMVVAVKADGKTFYVVSAIGREIMKKRYDSPSDYKWAKDFVRIRHLSEYATQLEPGYIDLDATEVRRTKNAVFVKDNLQPNL